MSIAESVSSTISTPSRDSMMSSSVTIPTPPPCSSTTRLICSRDFVKVRIASMSVAFSGTIRSGREISSERHARAPLADRAQQRVTMHEPPCIVERLVDERHTREGGDIGAHDIPDRRIDAERRDHHPRRHDRPNTRLTHGDHVVDQLGLVLLDRALIPGHRRNGSHFIATVARRGPSAPAQEL